MVRAPLVVGKGKPGLMNGLPESGPIEVCRVYVANALLNVSTTEGLAGVVKLTR